MNVHYLYKEATLPQLSLEYDYSVKCILKTGSIMTHKVFGELVVLRIFLSIDCVYVYLEDK